MGATMEIDLSLINKIPLPSLTQLGTSAEQFLTSLDAPSIIDIQGKNNQQWRVITTLLHGNEPSGFIATHKLLTEIAENKFTPNTNIRIIICSVEAAQLSPLFNHRYLPDGSDINRCFAGNQTAPYYQRAALIKQAIEEVAPEAIIDLHNTSGSGPAFGVSTSSNKEALALTSLFCDTLIISHIHIGALMELSFSGQIITIECGGCNDQHAHNIAFKGIKKFTSLNNLAHPPNIHPIHVIFKPLRLRLKKGTHLNYAKTNTKASGVILKSSIEKRNYGITHKGDSLGWVNNYEPDFFLLIDEHENNVFNDFLTVKKNKLIATIDLKIFMATKVAQIALNDCLFYVVKAQAL